MKDLQVLALLAVGLLIGCGGSQKTQKKTDVSDANQVAAHDAAGLVEARAPWLPDDTELVVVAYSEFFETVMAGMTPAGTSLEPWQKALSEEFFPGLGLKLFEAQSIVYAVSPNSVTVVFHGDFESPTNFESSQVDGKTVYHLDSIHDSVTNLDRRFNPPDKTAIRMVRVENPPGFVVHIDSAASQASESWPASLKSLEGLDRLTRFTSLLALAPRATMVGATVNGGESLIEVRKPLQALFGIDEVPDDLALSIAPALSLVIRADEPTLASTEQTVDENLSILRKKVERDLLDRVKFASYFEKLNKQKRPGMLVYSVPIASEYVTILSAYGKRPWRSVEPRQANSGDRAKIVVASSEIKSGTTITKSMLKTARLPRKFLRWTPLRPEDIDKYVGKQISRDVLPGHIIVKRDFD